MAVRRAIGARVRQGKRIDRDESIPEPYAIVDSMLQLLVRNLDPKVVGALKARAAKHGQSAEAEHRDILERALLAAPPEHDFKAFLRAAPATSALRLTRSKDRGRQVTL